MIEEAYVSFETAKLLKEKGFDEFCHAYYENEDNPNINIHGSKAINWNKTEFISKPTQQMAMRWLREVHHYYIQVMLDSWACGIHMGYYVVIQKTDSDFEIMLSDYVDNIFYQTYEEACETAIKYCLENLI